MSRLVVEDTPLAGLKRVRRNRLGDSRGFLARLFCADELAEAGLDRRRSRRSTTRERASAAASAACTSSARRTPR